MKSHLKKGFTLVELLVVIAILAILATVSIVGYSSFTKKANLSNDNTVIAELNRFVDAYKATDNEIYTVTDAQEVLDESGFDLSKIKTSSKGYHYAYDIVADEFSLLDDSFNLVEGYSVPSNGSVNLFAFVTSETERITAEAKGYSTYLQAAFDGTTLTGNVTKGIDVGKVTNVSTINYVNTSSSQNVVILTNSFETKVIINGKTGVAGVGDEVAHYGYAYFVDVQGVADASYEEYGIIGRLKITTGHIVAKDGCEVFCLMEVGGTATKDTTVETGAIVHEQVINLRDANGKVDGDDGFTLEKELDGVANGYVKVCASHDISNMAKIIVDSKYAYYVCKTCGYTLRSDSTPAETESNEVSNVEHIGEINSNDSHEEISICEHSFNYDDLDEDTHKATCSKCGVSFIGNHDTLGDNNTCSLCNHKGLGQPGSEDNPFVISNGKEWTDAPNHANGSEKTYFIVTASFDLTGNQTLNVPTDKNLSINMQSYQVSGNGDKNVVYNYGTLELKNGVLDTVKQTEFTCIRNFGTLVLNDVDIDSTWTGVYNRNDNENTPALLSVTNCRIYGNNLAIYNGEYTWDDDLECDIETGFGKVEIFSGEFKSCGTDSDNLGWDAISGTNYLDFTIHSGTFIYGPWHGEDAVPVGMLLATNSKLMSVYEQSNLIDNSESDTVSIIGDPKSIECSMQFEGEEEIDYASLVNAYKIYSISNKNATIKLKADFVTSQFDLFCYPVMTLNANNMGSLTLDLNGHTFEQTSHKLSNSGYSSTNGVELIIKDSSSNADGCYYTSNFNGLMSLNNSTTTIASGVIKRDTGTAAKNTIYIGNNATLYITGGTFVENKTKTTTNRKLFSFGSDYTSKIIITGGTFDGKAFASMTEADWRALCTTTTCTIEGVGTDTVTISK